MQKPAGIGYSQIIGVIKSRRNPRNLEGMARFGINVENAFGGISLPELRKLAKRAGKSHELALKLWDSGIHEARILASMVDEPERVTDSQMEAWVKGFNSWDICDQCCGNLFDKTNLAYEKAFEWSKRNEEYVKRAGYVLMAELAVHDKNAKDSELADFFPAIKRGSIDERNFVKKAVNWALRQIGKRNRALRKKALSIAEEIKGIDSKSAKWIASDAIRELKGIKSA